MSQILTNMPTLPSQTSLSLSKSIGASGRTARHKGVWGRSLIARRFFNKNNAFLGNTPKLFC